MVTGLLADLVERGMDATGWILLVLDGAKAMTTAVRKVVGSAALIQRCTVHKRRINRPWPPRVKAWPPANRLVRVGRDGVGDWR